ncbi:MAG TPA: AsmA domain protein, partial [Leptospiraceae bacterium]|nr:AsmA domain protein [Leptospiraceae bacterium]
MKKILYFVVIPLFVILALVSASAWYALKVVLNENFLVQQIESNLNVRAEVRKLNVSLFSAMSSVELEGVSLGARDSFANQGTPLSERPPMKGSVVTIGKIDLKFSLLPLLRRKFELNRFMLSSPVVSMTLFANGGNSLKPLFQKPLIVGRKPNPALAEKPAETAAKEEEKPFSAKDLPISADLREIG